MELIFSQKALTIINTAIATWKAALKGRLINGLITDESVAESIIEIAL